MGRECVSASMAPNNLDEGATARLQLRYALNSASVLGDQRRTLAPPEVLTTERFANVPEEVEVKLNRGRATLLRSTAGQLPVA